MLGFHINLVGALAVALIIGATTSFSQQTGQSSQGTQSRTAQQGAPQQDIQQQRRGKFSTDLLAGGGVNELKLPFASSLLPDLSSVQLDVTWDTPSWEWPRKHFCGQNEWPKRDSFSAAAVSRREADKPSEHFIGIQTPEPPCWYPMTQSALLKVAGAVAESNSNRRSNETLYEGKTYVTVFWLPLAVTLFAVGLIYPGCALVYWYMRQQRHERAKATLGHSGELPPAPSLLESLDPVQITANPWGRGSLSKLQIFLFTLIVFSLLLFFQLRSGVLADMSADVLWLLGISAVGAIGGKIVLTRNRRLSFENWAWLIRRGWLPESGSRDLAPRAKWSELFLDSDTNEFDPYSFQLAVFSLVVAVALARTSLTGLGTFKIPDQLLNLLGLSQVLFIGGKALAGGGYQELGSKLDEVRRHEQAVAVLDKKSDAKPEEKAAAENALKESVAQAAQMFAELYRGQLPNGIPEVVQKALNKIA